MEFGEEEYRVYDSEECEQGASGELITNFGGEFQNAEQALASYKAQNDSVCHKLDKLGVFILAKTDSEVKSWPTKKRPDDFALDFEGPAHKMVILPYTLNDRNEKIPMRLGVPGKNPPGKYSMGLPPAVSVYNELGSVGNLFDQSRYDAITSESERVSYAQVHPKEVKDAKYCLNLSSVDLKSGSIAEPMNPEIVAIADRLKELQRQSYMLGIGPKWYAAEAVRNQLDALEVRPKRQEEEKLILAAFKEAAEKDKVPWRPWQERIASLNHVPGDSVQSLLEKLQEGGGSIRKNMKQIGPDGTQHFFLNFKRRVAGSTVFVKEKFKPQTYDDDVDGVFAEMEQKGEFYRMPLEFTEGGGKTVPMAAAPLVDADGQVMRDEEGRVKMKRGGRRATASGSRLAIRGGWKFYSNGTYWGIKGEFDSVKRLYNAPPPKRANAADSQYVKNSSFQKSVVDFATDELLTGAGPAPATTASSTDTAARKRSADQVSNSSTTGDVPAAKFAAISAEQAELIPKSDLAAL
eukprot:TRINITY_DN5746_c0_g1_i1.p1 TRINITY_DN5746_c0_g1~~TRINITY_DN5746_c0_g1_i1.p1  ORF type:complete len:520 (+),score=106.92 TRINITY_DN5746_c0_g1_i1:562-2121(+)